MLSRYIGHGRDFAFLFVHIVGISVLVVRTVRDVEFKSSVRRPFLLPEKVCS